MAKKISHQEEKYALISVFSKKGIVELAKNLTSIGYKIISTGGTSKHLIENGVQIIPIQNITGNPESFDGRVKSVSFQVEGGILYDRTNPSHVKEAKQYKIKPIDIVICNLYPFEQTIQKPFTTIETAVENIDVGGPTLVRSAAKNFKNVIVIIDPNDYDLFWEKLQNNTVSFEFKKMLASKAFAHLSVYDSQIASFFSSETFPWEVSIPARLTSVLRYGENPHQKGALYSIPNQSSTLKNLEQLTGRTLSATNVLDINAGIESVRLFKKPAAAVIKHNSPCAIALGETPKQALQRAIEGDPESAFGGVIVLNKPMDLPTAKVIADFKDEKSSNIDIVAIPQIEKRALELLKSVRKSMGIYEFGTIKKTNPMQIKPVDGGFIMQTTDVITEKDFNSWSIVTTTKPTKIQFEQAKLAWSFIARIRSNAIIVIDKSLPMTRGIGTGQTSRIRSVKISLEQAGEYVKGGILASDSFFPFPDSVVLAGKYGIGAIVQQGGSVNDKASIEAADKLKIPMIFTGKRAFWH